MFDTYYRQDIKNKKQHLDISDMKKKLSDVITGVSIGILITEYAFWRKKIQDQRVSSSRMPRGENSNKELSAIEINKIAKEIVRDIVVPRTWMHQFPTQKSESSTNYMDKSNI